MLDTILDCGKFFPVGRTVSERNSSLAIAGLFCFRHGKDSRCEPQHPNPEGKIMKRSLVSFLLCAGALAMAAIAWPDGIGVAGAVAAVMVCAAGYALAVFMPLVSTSNAPKPKCRPEPRRSLYAVVRQRFSARHDKPRMTSSWRMCPSG